MCFLRKGLVFGLGFGFLWNFKPKHGLDTHKEPRIVLGYIMVYYCILWYISPRIVLGYILVYHGILWYMSVKEVLESLGMNPNLVAAWIHFTLFWDNITHNKAETVHFWGLMNSTTKLNL